MTEGPGTIQSDPVLQEVVRRLVATYQPDRIYLFGSHARGEATSDSDYDLLVVVSNTTPLAARQSARAYEALWGLGVGADVLVWTQRTFDERLHLRAIVGDALFHCQQAIEKALKAFLTWHDEPFRKTHDLGELGTQCVTLDDTLTALLRRAAPLDRVRVEVPLSR